MKIFLTGINGFSGSHLVKHLLKKDYHVVGITRSPLDSSLITAELPNGDFTLLHDNLNNLEKLPNNIDAVIHTAAISPTPTTEVSHFIHDNILATQKLVSLAHKANVKRFIFFSSLSIHGEIKETVVNENTPILNPDVYGTSKLLGEFCLKECAKMMPSIALRLPAVLGKGASRHWLATTIARACKGETIKIYNPEQFFNNAVHIFDLCNLIDRLLVQPLTGFTPLTLGAEGYMSIQSIIEKVIQSCHSTSKVIIEQKLQNSFTICSDHAKNQYQYTPLYMDEMLDKYLNEIQIHKKHEYAE
jgi:nucleoside-diphosphate-sugar epimerase